MPDMITQNLKQTGADSAAWSDAEKIAYLIILCEFEGSLESKIVDAPAPGGRSKASCKELFATLKREHEYDIKKIKDGQAVNFKAFEKPAPDADAEILLFGYRKPTSAAQGNSTAQAARGNSIVRAEEPPMPQRITRWDVNWRPRKVEPENERVAVEVKTQLEGDE